MGSVPLMLVDELKVELGLRRAVETGTFMGGGARQLATVFDSVVTIELSEPLHTAATEALADIPNVKLKLGDSRQLLPAIAAQQEPTLYWLDGHWSGGQTAGAADECPVLDEISAVGVGHADDCVLIDDARLFAAAPPPPHDPSQWPTLVEVLDALRRAKNANYVTVLHDIVIAVPARARHLVDEFGRRGQSSATSAPFSRLRGRIAGLGRFISS
jgi:hypothetical protein